MLVADTSGESVDNKIRLDLIRQQEELIRDEAEEKKKEVCFPFFGCFRTEGR